MGERLDVVDERRLAVAGRACRGTAACSAARRACLRGASSSAVSSPRMYPPGETKTSMSNRSRAESLPASRGVGSAARSARLLRPRTRGAGRRCPSPRRRRGRRAAIPSMTRCGTSARIFASLNVPGSLSSALQMTYFGVRCSLRDQLPLGAGREAGPAHAAEAARLRAPRSPVRTVASASRSAGGWRRSSSGRRVRVEIPASRRAASWRTSWVRPSPTAPPRPRRPGDRCAIEQPGRGAVAAADARHLVHLDVSPPSSCSLPALLHAGQVARHVAADGQFDPRRRGGAEVRVEADELLQDGAAGRSLCGEFAERRLGQVAVPCWAAVSSGIGTWTPFYRRLLTPQGTAAGPRPGLGRTVRPPCGGELALPWLRLRTSSA